MEAFDHKMVRGKNKCYKCKKEFGFTKREHVCKRCFRSVCDKCAPGKLNVFTLNYKKQSHRGCQICQQEYRFSLQIIQKNKLQPGKDSQIGLSWIKKVNKQKLGLSFIKKQYMQMGRSKGKQVQGYQKKIKQIQKTLWGSFSFWMREWIGLTCGMPINKQLISAIDSVIIAILNKLAISFKQEMVHLCLFLISFLSEANCYFIMVCYFSLPDYQSSLITILQEHNLSQEQSIGLHKFIKNQFNKIRSSMLVNFLPIQLSLKLIDYFTQDLSKFNFLLVSFFIQNRKGILQSKTTFEIYLSIYLNNNSSKVIQEYNQNLKNRVYQKQLSKQRTFKQQKPFQEQESNRINMKKKQEVPVFNSNIDKISAIQKSQVSFINSPMWEQQSFLTQLQGQKTNKVVYYSQQREHKFNQMKKRMQQLEQLIVVHKNQQDNDKNKIKGLQEELQKSRLREDKSKQEEYKKQQQMKHLQELLRHKQKLIQRYQDQIDVNKKHGSEMLQRIKKMQSQLIQKGIQVLQYKEKYSILSNKLNPGSITNDNVVVDQCTSCQKLQLINNSYMLKVKQKDDQIEVLAKDYKQLESKHNKLEQEYEKDGQKIKKAVQKQHTLQQIVQKWKISNQKASQYQMQKLEGDKRIDLLQKQKNTLKQKLQTLINQSSSIHQMYTLQEQELNQLKGFNKQNLEIKQKLQQKISQLEEKLELASKKVEEINPEYIPQELKQLQKTANGAQSKKIIQMSKRLSGQVRIKNLQILLKNQKILKISKENSKLSQQNRQYYNKLKELGQQLVKQTSVHVNVNHQQQQQRKRSCIIF